MSWEERLRDMVLAGGTLAVSACSNSVVVDFPCCNASPDPCCICGAGPVNPALCAELTACGAEGGSFDGVGCSFPAEAGVDFVPAEASAVSDALSDAPPDVAPVFAGVCCNADPDPCCICNGAPMNEPLCEQETACKADGGVYNFELCNICGPDGGPVSQPCALPDQADASDASGDGASND